jgi:hypothetical protein
MKNTLIITGVVFLLISLVLIFQPYSATGRHCKQITGKVISVIEDGTKDAVFKIAGEHCSYYINRGLEKKFNLKDLNEMLNGKEVSILYEDKWSPLVPYEANKHISELSMGSDLLYSELPK